MTEKELKTKILASVDDKAIPDVRMKAINKYNDNKEHKQSWFRRNWLYVTAPTLAGAVACAVIIPIALLSANKGVLRPAKLSNSLQADKSQISFNVSNALSALNIISSDSSSTNTNKAVIKQNLISSRQGEEALDESSSEEQINSPAQEFNSSLEVEGLFNVLNPYMPTVEALLKGTNVDPEVYESNVEGYSYLLDNFVFNMSENDDGTYTISGKILDSEITVDGGRFDESYDGNSVSALLLNFNYSENKYLSFAHISYSSVKTFEDIFEDDDFDDDFDEDFNERFERGDIEDIDDESEGEQEQGEDSSSETFTLATSLDYYEYALYENNELVSFVGIDSYRVNENSRAYVTLNVPNGEEGYVNADVSLTLNKDNEVKGRFDLVRDYNENSEFADDKPFGGDGHHHGGHPFEDDDDDFDRRHANNRFDDYPPEDEQDDYDDYEGYDDPYGPEGPEDYEGHEGYGDPYGPEGPQGPEGPGDPHGPEHDDHHGHGEWQGDYFRMGRIRGSFTYSETESSYKYVYQLKGRCFYHDDDVFGGHGHGEDLEVIEEESQAYEISK